MGSIAKHRSVRWILLLIAALLAACAGKPYCVPVNDIICKTPMQIAEKSYSEDNCVSARINWGREAKAGNAAAQNNMGLIWEKGCPFPEAPAYSIPQSYTEAYNWFMLAATNGEPTAAYNLGRYHENGLGVEKDIGKAIAWYTLAARKGNEQARLRLTTLGQPVPPADLINAVVIQQPRTQPSAWRELGEWIVAFAGAYALGAAYEYRQPDAPSTVDVNVRANCRTRVIGDMIKTECY